MPRESEKRISEFKAGLFIIISIVLLIFSVLWLRYFAVSPKMTIIAKFSNPGPVSKGLPAYYQGVNIGRISDVQFTKDFEYTLIYMQIYRKDLILPSNVHAEVKQQGITGQTYIDIIYPQYPSKTMLADKTIINGKSPFNISDLQNFFGSQISSGRMEQIFANLEESTANINKLSIRLDRMSEILSTILENNKTQVNTFLKQAARAATNISSTSQTINSFLHDSDTQNSITSMLTSTSEAARSLNEIAGDPEVKKGIKSAIGGIGKIFGNPEETFGNAQVSPGFSNEMKGSFSNFNSLLRKSNLLVDNLNLYSNDIYNDIKQSCLIENASCTFAKVNTTLEGLNKAGTGIGNGNLKDLITNTLSNTNQAAKRVDCTSTGISDMLSKRFLLFRLLFGKPGSSLEQCQKLQGKTAPCIPVK